MKMTATLSAQEIEQAIKDFLYKQGFSLIKLTTQIEFIHCEVITNKEQEWIDDYDSRR